MSKSTSVFFLDVDGVLNSAKTGWYCWDKYTVNWIIWLAKMSNSKFVISSTWRKYHDYNFFNEILKDLVHDDWRTVSLYKDINGNRIPRGQEIKQWLENHPEIKQYIIFDDDTDILEEQQSFFINTDSNEGTLFEHLIKARDILNIKTFPDSEVLHMYHHPIMDGEKWYWDMQEIKYATKNNRKINLKRNMGE